MILNKAEIKYAIEDFGLVTPYNLDNIQAASYDFTLGNKFATFALAPRYVDLDLMDAENALRVTEIDANAITLAPHECVLAQSAETFNFPEDLAGMVKTKSSLGRLFLAVSNGDACWFDPGFKGVAVLEIVNHGPIPIRLQAGMKIGQMIFLPVDNAYEGAYNGNYQIQTDFASDRWLAALAKIGRNANRAN